MRSIRRLMLTACVIVAGVLVATAFAADEPPVKKAPPPPRIQTPPDGVEVLRDVEYGKVGDRALKLNIIRPKVQPKEAMPVFAWIHGGAWMSGSKEQHPWWIFTLAQRGYFCVSVDYRLSGEAKFPAQIEDCKCAIRWLRAHAKDYNINPDRIGCAGSSAGGHLVALLGASGDAKDLEGKGGWENFSSRVQAVVDFCGPTDFLQVMEGYRKSGLRPGIRRDLPNCPEAQLVGGPLEEKKEECKRANPITYITKDDPPFFIVHGEADNIVPVNQSELLDEALRKAGVESTFHVVKGGGHGASDPEADRMILEFLDKHLKQGH